MQRKYEKNKVAPKATIMTKNNFFLVNTTPKACTFSKKIETFRLAHSTGRVGKPKRLSLSKS